MTARVRGPRAEASDSGSIVAAWGSTSHSTGVAPARERFQRELETRGVGTFVHYPLPIHKHPPYAELGGRVGLENSERLADRVVSMPLYPELREEEVEHVAGAAREAASSF